MRRTIAFTLLFCASIAAIATYKGLPQIACDGCSVSVEAIRQHAYEHTQVLGWLGAWNFYILDTSTQKYFRIEMDMVRRDGSYAKDFREWDTWTRMIDGILVPDKVRIRVYDDATGVDLGSRDYDLLTQFNNGRSLPDNAIVATRGANNVYFYVSYGYIRTYVGWNRTYSQILVGGCYGGRCQDAFE